MKEQSTFQVLKDRISKESVLIILDLNRTFEVYCDASGDCVGEVLNQEGHSVAFESRRLRDAELHASIYKEGAYVIWL